VAYFSQAPLPRQQQIRFPTTLDEAIAEDHPVRLLDEILQRLDWSVWEAHYRRAFGRPPHPPRVMAGILLYGLQCRVRSSRLLEYLVGHNFDFMWLAEGRHIDHSTLSKFRKRFRDPLRDLFRQINRLALAAGLIRLVEVGFDGTRVKANNSRYETWTAAEVEALLNPLQAEFERRLDASIRNDGDELMRLGDLPAQPLPPELAERQARQEKLQQTLAKLQAADAERAKQGIDVKKNPAQIPKSDPDAKVLPNKEGGYAPNYTPLAATDGHCGFIVDADVIAETTEHLQTLPMVDRIAQELGQPVQTALADGAHATGANIVGLAERGVELLTNLKSAEPGADHPARRDDPTQPVAEAKRAQLPINPQSKRLDKSNFLYDAARDCYWCPMGQPLAYAETKTDQRQGEQVAFRVYRCARCAGCPLAARCRSGTNQGGRTVSRDAYAADRERLAAKMATPEAQQRYKRRMPIAETVFGRFKGVWGLRQFLLRGLENVKTEWLWACTAHNLMKLVREMARLRAQVAALASADG
jgi:transposase